jgi:hypothetical protein
LQICHFLSYIFIFSGTSFRQESAGDVTHALQLKRKYEDAVCHPNIKKRRMMELTKDAVEIFGGPLDDDDDDDDDDVLVLDTDEELIKEMDELLNDLKLYNA